MRRPCCHEEVLMKAIAIAAAALGVFALSSWSPPASAATCFREVVNSPSGHRELVRGCYTRERIATRTPRRTDTTGTVSIVYYSDERPYTSTVTLQYASASLTRVFEPLIFYGASTPAD